MLEEDRNEFMSKVVHAVKLFGKNRNVGYVCKATGLSQADACAILEEFCSDEPLFELPAAD